jgi:hypothetical protein
VPVIRHNPRQCACRGRAADHSADIGLDSHSLRVLSNDVADPRYRIPPFEVESPVVFLSNLDFDDHRAFAPRIWKSAIPALKSRTRIITLPFDKKAILDYTSSSPR